MRDCSEIVALKGGLFVTLDALRLRWSLENGRLPYVGGLRGRFLYGIDGR